MKTVSSLFMLGLMAFCFSFSVNAQSSQPNLDQVELMKKWTGTWKCEISKDTVIIWDLKPFGKGYELYYKSIANGKTIFEIKDLWTFNSKSDRWICFSLEGSGRYQYKMYYGKFSSSSKFYWDRYNIAKQEKILGSWDFTFYPQSESEGSKFDFIAPNSPTVLTFYRLDADTNTNHQ